MRAIRNRRAVKKSLNNDDCVVVSVSRGPADDKVFDLILSDTETKAEQVRDPVQIVHKEPTNDLRSNVQNQREFEHISNKVKKPERRSRSRVRNKRKYHKREVTPVEPIFLWAYKRETEILKVVCENIDNRLRLVKTSSGEWKSAPLTKVRFRAPWLPPPNKNQNVSDKKYGSDDDQRNNDSGDESDDESGGDSENEIGGESIHEPEKVGPDEPIVETVEETPKSSEDCCVNLIEDSIDFIDTVSSDEDKEEQRATIDRALEMIDQDPALTKDSKVTLPDVASATLKLPEGTTIHQVKVEDVVNRSVTITPSSLSPIKTPSQCTFGELTIIPQQQQEQQHQQYQQPQQYQHQRHQQYQQQQQQSEPLNLETVGKRSSFKIKLQEPPYKKKRNDPVKYEYDALAQLKDVLSDPKLTVPDPLIVPRDRLAALVASPAAEIPKLLQTQSPLLPPLSNTELLTISLSHLKYLLQQQPGFTEEKKASQGTQSTTNFDQMLWSYLSSKDLASTVDNSDLIPSLLSLLMPNPPNVQQAFNYPPQKNSWNDIYYGSNIAPLYDSAAAAAATVGYNKQDVCYTSVSPLPPQQQQPQLQLPCSMPQKYSQMPLLQSIQPQQKSPMLPPTQQPQHKSRLSSPSVQHNVKQRVCQDPYCNSSPTTCYESCCMKNSVCNPFTTLTTTGCNPYNASPAGAFGANSKNNCSPACTMYSTDGSGTCCYSSQVDCGYSGQSSGSSTPRKSPYSRSQYNYPNHGFDQQQQRFIAEYGNNGVTNNIAVDRHYANKPQTSPTAVAALSRDTASKPLQKAKIKVKNLVDPNYKHNLINYEGALHLAKTNPQDLLSSSLWHPLFSGKTDKKYDCCRWQWTTPASPPSSTSSYTSGKR